VPGRGLGCVDAPLLLIFSFFILFFYLECLVEVFVDARLVFDVLGAVGKFERGQRLGEGLEGR